MPELRHINWVWYVCTFLMHVHVYIIELTGVVIIVSGEEESIKKMEKNQKMMGDCDIRGSTEALN